MISNTNRHRFLGLRDIFCLRAIFFLFRGVFFALILSSCGMPMTVALRAQYFSDAVSAYDRDDYADAGRLWGVLARDHDLSAMVNLGFMYEHGLGTDMNFKLAHRWYFRAAELGFASAQLRLADLIRSEDLSRAQYWDRMAAFGGHPLGIYRYALFLSSKGHDILRVCAMMSRSADAGILVARSWLTDHGCDVLGYPADDVGMGTGLDADKEAL